MGYRLLNLAPAVNSVDTLQVVSGLVRERLINGVVSRGKRNAGAGGRCVANKEACACIALESLNRLDTVFNAGNCAVDPRDTISMVPLCNLLETCSKMGPDNNLLSLILDKFLHQLIKGTNLCWHFVVKRVKHSRV